MTETPWRVLKTGSFKLEMDPMAVNIAFHHPLEEVSKLPEIWRQKPSNGEVIPEKYDFEDPLGATNADDEPLTVDVDIKNDIKKRSCSLDNTLELKRSDRSGFDIELPDFVPWREKRAKLMSLARPKEFSLNQSELLRLQIDDLLKDPSKTTKKASEISKEILNFKENMLNAWIADNRIESFKNVINVEKIIEEMSENSEDYTYAWLLCLEVFDNFGRLVYDRLLEKANQLRNENGHSALPEHFNEKQVPIAIQEMAKNWFSKVKQVPTVVCQVYVQGAILGCIRFYEEESVVQNLESLVEYCSTITNCIPALLDRVYLCRISMHITPNDRTIPWRTLHQCLQKPKNVMESGFAKALSDLDLRNRRIQIECVAWIIQCVSYCAHTLEDLAPLFVVCKKVPLDEHTYILISSCVEGLPSKYLAMHSKDILDMIFLMEHSYEEPLTMLGRRFKSTPPVEEDRNSVKRTVFTRIGDISNFEEYVKCLTEWIGFVVKFFEMEQVKEVLEFVLIRLKVDEGVKDSKNDVILINLMNAFIENIPENEHLIQLMSNSNFVAVLDLIGFDRVTASKCGKKFLEVLIRRFKRSTIDSSAAAEIILEQAVNLCKCLNFEHSDETNLSEELIGNALILIDLKSRENPMQCIDFLVKARASLGLRHIILERIIEILTDFTFHCYTTLKQGAKKAEFMRICITNLAISVPAIRNEVKRFDMSLKVVQLSLLANFLPQVDTSCRRCLETLESLSSTNPCSQIALLINNFLAILCHVPDSPTRNKPLYFYQKLLALIAQNEEIHAWKRTPKDLCDIYMNCLRYLCTTRRLDEHNELIRGNNVMYAGDDEFASFVDSNIDTIMAKLLSLANDPFVAMAILENVVMLFEIHEEIRSTLRGLLKRAVGSPKTSKRLDAVISDLKEKAESDENVMIVVQKLGLI